MGRFSCCWCLFILLIFVVIVTNLGNAKKNSKQKRQKKEYFKSSEATESTVGNKQQKRKKKGETKPSEGRRKKVKKNRSAQNKARDYSTTFDPNWACKPKQARNYCFGSGFAGHDVGTCTCEAREVKKVKPCNSCVRQQVLKGYGNQPWEHPDAERLIVKMNMAVDEAFRKAGPDALREHLEWERTTSIKPDISCRAAGSKLKGTRREREQTVQGKSDRDSKRTAPGRSDGTTRGRERAASGTASGEDSVKSRYQQEDDTETCYRLPDDGLGTCGAP